MKSNGFTIVVALLIAALLCGASAIYVKRSITSVSFDTHLANTLKAKRPDVVLVGSSVLGSNVIQKELTAALSKAANRPVKVFYVWNGSIQTGFHYLAMKNVIAPNTAPGTPVVFVNYEDWFVRPINARMKEPHINRRYRALMRDDETVFLSKIGYLADQFTEQSIGSLQASNMAKRKAVSSIIAKILPRVAHLNSSDLKAYKRDQAQFIQYCIGRTFSLKTFRTTNEQPLAASDDKTTSLDSPRPTSSDFPQVIYDSFLPEIAQFSSLFKIYLVVSPSRPDVFEAVNAARIVNAPLREFAQAHNMKFLDLNGLPEISNPALYIDSRHFRPGKQRLMYTRVFAQKLVDAGILER